MAVSIAAPVLFVELEEIVSMFNRIITAGGGFVGNVEKAAMLFDISGNTGA
jgi:hypothetical protein